MFVDMVILFPGMILLFCFDVSPSLSNVVFTLLSPYLMMFVIANVNYTQNILGKRNRMDQLFVC